MMQSVKDLGLDRPPLSMSRRSALVYAPDRPVRLEIGPRLARYDSVLAHQFSA